MKKVRNYTYPAVAGCIQGPFLGPGKKIKIHQTFSPGKKDNCHG